MADKAKVLALAGSARAASFNKRLLKIAAEGAEAEGAAVTLVSLSDFDLPLFNQDDLAADGFPPGVVALKDAFKSHDGLLIASPEYNSSVSGPLKNALDWVSRTMGDEDWKECFVGKTAGLMCATTGGGGGLKGILHLRDILSACMMTVIPQQVLLAKAGDAFDGDALRDADVADRTRALGAELARVVGKLHS